MKQVKRNKVIFLWGIIIIPGLLFIAAFINKTAVKNTPKSVKGRLDASNWDFSRNGNIELNGEWEFYWNQLYTSNEIRNDSLIREKTYIRVPGIWNNVHYKGIKLSGKGYATFRQQIQLPPVHERLSMKLLTMSSAYKLFINDVEFCGNGVVGTDASLSKPAYLSQVIVLPDSIKSIDLVVHVSNFHHWKGGIWHPIKLGSVDAIRKERETRIILEMFLFGCIFIMGLYHFGLFSLRKSDISTLFFGLVCVFIGLRSLFTGENLIHFIIPDFNWFIARKIEFILTFLSIPAYAAFSYSLFKEEWNKWVYKTMMWIGVLLAWFVLLAPSYYFTFCSYIFTPYSAISSLYILFVFLLATIRKREGGDLFLVTTIFFFLAVINEMLNQTEVIHSGLYLPVGLLVVVFAQSYILSLKTSNAFLTSELYAQTFQKFVPKQFLDRIAKDGLSSIKPGNAEKGEVTVLFSDIRSFTSIAEKMSADEVFAMLNEYLSYVEPPIRDNLGFVDKYMGDGIMALFEHSGNQQGADNAIKAALAMRRALETYNKIREQRNQAPLAMGLGIHSGQVIIGTLGGNERMDSTAIGDAVNLCSRIEGMTKMYGANILVSSYTLQLVERKSSFIIRFVDYVVAKGKSEPIGICEILADDQSVDADECRQLVAAFDKALACFRENKLDEARQYFTTCLTIRPTDELSRIYLKRIEDFKSSGTHPGTITYLFDK